MPTRTPCDTNATPAAHPERSSLSIQVEVYVSRGITLPSCCPSINDVNGLNIPLLVRVDAPPPQRLPRRATHWPGCAARFPRCSVPRPPESPLRRQYAARPMKTYLARGASERAG